MKLALGLLGFPWRYATDPSHDGVLAVKHLRGGKTRIAVASEQVALLTPAELDAGYEVRLPSGSTVSLASAPWYSLAGVRVSLGSSELRWQYVNSRRWLFGLATAGWVLTLLVSVLLVTNTPPLFSNPDRLGDDLIVVGFPVVCVLFFLVSMLVRARVALGWQTVGAWIQLALSGVLITAIALLLVKRNGVAEAALAAFLISVLPPMCPVGLGLAHSVLLLSIGLPSQTRFERALKTRGAS